MGNIETMTKFSRLKSISISSEREKLIVFNIKLGTWDDRSNFVSSMQKVSTGAFLQTS